MKQIMTAFRDRLNNFKLKTKMNDIISEMWKLLDHQVDMIDSTQGVCQLPFIIVYLFTTELKRSISQK